MTKLCSNHHFHSIFSFCLYLCFLGDDSHVLKKQEEVIQESFMMISDCQRRLTAAFSDLKAVLENEKDLSESEEYQNASKALELALPHF